LVLDFLPDDTVNIFGLGGEDASIMEQDAMPQVKVVRCHDFSG
jgi:hypothetical protein